MNPVRAERIRQSCAENPVTMGQLNALVRMGIVGTRRELPPGAMSIVVDDAGDRVITLATSGQWAAARRALTRIGVEHAHDSTELTLTVPAGAHMRP